MTFNNYEIQERKQRWADFYLMDKKPQTVFIINYFENKSGEKPPEPPKLWPERKKERIEYSWYWYNKQREKAEWLADDTVPCLQVMSGTEIYAEAFGCKVSRPQDNLPYAIPLVQTIEEASKISVPRLEDTTLMLLFDIADELKSRADRDAVFRLPDVQSPMDIVAQIWNKEDLFLAMIEEPEAVKELVEKVKLLLYKFLDQWFRRYGNEFIAHYPYYYMPYGITLSEDEIGSVSPGMFKEFFLPELKEISSRYGGIGIHCCADARHQWDGLKEIPDLKMLNLVQPPSVIDEAFEFFAEHVPQVHSYLIDGTAHPLTFNMPEYYPKESRIVINVPADSRKEALEMSERLWLACGRD